MNILSLTGWIMGTEHLPPGRKDAPRFETDHPGKDGWRFPAAGKKSGKKILHSPDIEGRLMFKISKIGLFSHIRNTILVYVNP
jgi:hypothetical protein